MSSGLQEFRAVEEYRKIAGESRGHTLWYDVAQRVSDLGS